jgi:benzoyl-CoA reductase subunit B
MATTPAADVQKDRSQIRQKRMIAEHFERLERSPETGEKAVYTYVPGNLTELVRIFGALPVLPEINALQSAMRGRSRNFISVAENLGHSEDVCAYVKCDIGMQKSGNVGPTNTKLPDPGLLLLSYTGCFTFMKWFELLKEQWSCPVVFLHVPYQGEGEVTPAMRRYVVDQLKKKVIPALEEVTGVAYDEDRLREMLVRSAQAEDDLVAVLESAKHRPSPIDAWFGGVYYVGPMFTAFRGTEDAVAYYRELREEIDERVRSRPTASSSRSATGSWWRGRPTGRTSARSGRSSRRRAPSPSLPPTRRWAASTTRASGTTPTTRSRRWPTTAWAATRTCACRRARTCSRSTSKSTTPTGSSCIP